MRAIAKELGRPVSTISGEIARNTGPNEYRPYAAHRTAAKRRPRPKPGKLSTAETLRRFVSAKLLLGWSSGQISKRLGKVFLDRLELRVCYETIYLALYIQAKGGPNRAIVSALRIGRNRREPGKRTPRFWDPMVDISERPPEVEDRAVSGHWKGDLITGALNQSAIGTLASGAPATSCSFTAMAATPRNGSATG